MKKLMLSRHLASALSLAAIGLLATPSYAQQTGAAPAAPVTMQAALAADVATLGEKFEGLAKVMAGKYDWKPGEGVRSAGDVFNLIVNENKMLVGVLAGTGGGPRGPRPAPITDPAELQAALRASYADLKQALAALSDSDLKASVRMFGRDTTKQGAALMLLFDQHEHLGQSIAYARSNGVVPPWSQGGK
jgi:uncharacterized damage-inducible protein DinB